MFERNYYNIHTLADELNIGESTLLYWQDQYSQWIPCIGRGKEKWYPKDAVNLLRFIMESAKNGLDTKAIENELKQKYKVLEETNQLEVDSLSPPDSIYFQSIKNALTNLAEQQHRIADAQERRAHAEERKASALEKRAEAQHLTANALNHLAEAVKGFVQNTPYSASTSNSINSAAEITTPEPIQKSQPTSETGNLSDLIDSIQHEDSETSQSTAIELDDLSELIDQPIKTSTNDLDDLSDLIDSGSKAPESQIDNLDDLLESKTESDQADIDDLFDLIDQSSESIDSSETPETELDDLSALVDEPASAQKLDDLSELIDSSSPKAAAPDDLSDLLDSPQEKAQELDDLADLIESPAPPKEEPAPIKSVSPPKEKSNIIPGDYKSKMIALIIAMKEKQGLSIEETLNHLFEKGYQPFPGEEKWDKKTIAQIYNHIDMVRAKKSA